MAQKQTTKVGKKFVKNTRNVLALPKEAFWPILQEPDSSKLLELLKNVLKPARTIQPLIPWKDKQKLSKVERKNMITEFYKNLPQDSLDQHKKALNLRKHLSLGINEVTRAVEKNELACCLVSGNVNPKLLVSHFVDLCKNRRIPVLIVNTLKENITDALGFSSLAIGFKNDIQKNSAHEMHGLCNEIINFFCKNYTYDSDKHKEDGDMEVDISKPLMEENFFDVEKEKNPLLCPINDINLDEIYLYRTSNSYRVFKPNKLLNSLNDHSDSDSKMDSTFEINLKYSGEEEYNKIVTKKRRYYEPPKIFRIQQNNPLKWHKPKKKK